MERCWQQAKVEFTRESYARERNIVAIIQLGLLDGSSFINQFPLDAPWEKAWQFTAQAERPTTSMVHSSRGDIWTLLGMVLYPCHVIWTLISNFLFGNTPPAQTSLITTSSEPSNCAPSSNSEKKRTSQKGVSEKHGEDFKKEGRQIKDSMMVKMKTLGMQILFNRCSETRTICAIIIALLLQFNSTKILLGCRIALCFPTNLYFKVSL